MIIFILIWSWRTFELEFFEKMLGFRFNFFVMLTKCSFIILAICFSSFSTSVIFIELEPLSLKYGLTFFQNSLFSVTFLTFDLAKYCFFVFRKRFRQRFHWCFYFYQLKWVLFLLKMFLNFDRSIITFLITFVIKQLLLCRNIFFLSGACLFNSFKNVVSKSS